MRPRSFNGQLLLVIVGVIALCWLAVLAVVVTQLSQNRISTWDDKLTAIATQILVTIPAASSFRDRSGPGLQLPSSSHADEPLAFQVWVDGRRLVARTPDAPDTALQPTFADGTASTTVAGRQWRVHSITDSTGKITVQVGNLQSVVDADLRHEAAHALVLATLLLIVAGVIMRYVVRHALKPIQALGSAMRQRSNLDFTPLPLTGLPRELQPLLESFNHLLGQLDRAIEGERRFIGDAAHELRTPLSAVQAQAEIALCAADASAKDVALTKLLAVARRSSRLSEQLLDLARLNAGAKAPQHAPAELSALVQHVAQEFEVSASQNGRALYLDVHACVIDCNIDEIGILLRNLVDNAMRYSGPGGQVLVHCDYRPLTEGGGVLLEVSDDGPGVPACEHKAIFERFHRVAGTPTRGSGIGLSLVAGIAALHQASISTDTGLDGRGLKVAIRFPPASAAPLKNS
ncbi:MAG: ATP-binding protein [Duganella sp.]